ncbi:hypothetical protein L1987_40183 [Smallanthus sonchifolius]|uniref:Uncharacterized protein n=1 Tax=Smallanthus sonchifolius TaxID=185202 RepID=A0ACB9GTX7_9ASTR|nr:hypothetical protein L1987_40183 [Smallanthus sonchifolius]
MYNVLSFINTKFGKTLVGILLTVSLRLGGVNCEAGMFKGDIVTTYNTASWPGQAMWSTRSPPQSSFVPPTCLLGASASQPH